MDFVRGNTKTKLKALRDIPKKESGTTVWFKPDKEIFTATEYNYDKAMLSSVAYGQRALSYSYDRKTGALSTKDSAGTSAVTVDSGGLR